MATTTTISPAIGCTGLPFSLVEADLLVVPWFEDEGPAAVPGIDAASGGELARALQSKEFAGRSFDIFSTRITDPAWRVRRLVVVGAGKRSSFGTDIGRRLAVAVGLWARQRRVARRGLRDARRRRRRRRHGARWRRRSPKG